MNDSVVCYSTISDTPKEIWASNVGFGYEHAPSMQMEKDDIVVPKKDLSLHWMQVPDKYCGNIRSAIH